MFVRKGQLPIFAFNILVVVILSIYFIASDNYEFMIYVGVIVFFLAVIIFVNNKVYFPNTLLWGLTIWALLHLLGGSVTVNGSVLYDLILIPLSQQYPIFRFDQFVHIYGFAIATFTMFYVLKPLLKTDISKWWSLSIIVIAAGTGMGALNEVVEFTATVFLPKTHVGDYTNNALDLVSNLIGALIAMLIIRLIKKRFLGET